MNWINNFSNKEFDEFTILYGNRLIEENDKFESILEHRDFYVYIYLDPTRKGTYKINGINLKYRPFYVGKGRNTRYQDDISYIKNGKTISNKIKNSFIQKIIVNKLSPILYISRDMNEIQAFILEKKLIKSFGRIENGGLLSNFTDGGDGQCGRFVSKETRQKMSLIRKGRKLGPPSKEHRLKNSLAHRGKNHNWYGKKLTKEHKEKISKSQRGEKAFWYGNILKKETIEKIRKKALGHEYNARTYELIFPDNKILIVYNLAKYCRENNLEQTGFTLVLKGIKKDYNGIKIKIIKDYKRKDIKNG